MLSEYLFILLVNKLRQLLASHRKYLVQPPEHKTPKVFIRYAQNRRSVRLWNGPVKYELLIVWNHLSRLRVLWHGCCLRVKDFGGTWPALVVFRVRWRLHITEWWVIDYCLSSLRFEGAGEYLSRDEGVLHSHGRSPSRVLINSEHALQKVNEGQNGVHFTLEDDVGLNARVFLLLCEEKGLHVVERGEVVDVLSRRVQVDSHCGLVLRYCLETIHVVLGVEEKVLVLVFGSVYQVLGKRSQNLYYTSQLIIFWVTREYRDA